MHSQKWEFWCTTSGNHKGNSVCSTWVASAGYLKIQGSEKINCSLVDCTSEFWENRRLCFNLFVPCFIKVFTSMLLAKSVKIVLKWSFAKANPFLPVPKFSCVPLCSFSDLAFWRKSIHKQQTWLENYLEVPCYICCWYSGRFLGWQVFRLPKVRFPMLYMLYRHTIKKSILTCRFTVKS